MNAAVGLRAHSGWAALVALAGPKASPSVVDRRHMELDDGKIKGARQPYHAAEGLPLARAEKLIGRCEETSRRLALDGLRTALVALRKEHEVVGCGLLLASGRPLGPLSDTLASHAKIHTADGEHFRQALAHAGGQCGLPVARVREKEVRRELARAMGWAEEELDRRLADLGRKIGPPWRQDEKLAAAASWLVLTQQLRVRRQESDH
ncbi:MAG: hypothetical protein H7X85_00710 [Thermoanaerobaculia bacterium]|nr:hypothetical protein [Thermoanaerobaculia bacterium]